MTDKPKEKSKEDLLEDFSGRLIELGNEIEARLTEKGKLDEELKTKGVAIRKLEKEIFAIRTRLAKLSTELSKLETRRREFEEKKLLLEKEKK